MAGRKPDYKVMVSREGRAKDGSDKNYYSDIGVAWRVANDGISVQLNAVPVDGRMVLFPIEEKDPR